MNQMNRIMTTLRRIACGRLIALGILLAMLTTPLRADEAAQAETDWLPDLARKMEAALTMRDRDALIQLCDNDGFVDHVMSSVKGTIGYRTGVRQSLQHGLTQLLLDSTAPMERITLLRTRTYEGHPSALFRLLAEGGGVAYQEVLFKTMPDGEHRAFDSYVATSAERFSAILQRFIALGAEQENEGAGDAFVQGVLNMTDAQKEGRFEDALKVYHGLPEVVRKNKTLLILRMMCAVNVSDQEMRAAADDFRSLYPDDPACDILMLDVYFTNREWAQAHECVQRLRVYAGEDAYLDYLQGAIHIASEQPVQARSMFETSAKREPTLLDPHWALLELDLAGKDHKAALYRIKQIESLGIEFSEENMRAAELYEEFVAAPEFQTWLKEHNEKKAADPAPADAPVSE